MKPECEIDSTGTKRWYLNKLLHREDGPAIEYTDGATYWWLNGKRHREDGPAYKAAGEFEVWYLNNVIVQPFTLEQLPLILLQITEL